MRKLSEDDVGYIRKHYTKKKEPWLAKKFDIDHLTVERAFKRMTYKYVA
jgi:hypothetical protein